MNTTKLSEVLNCIGIDTDFQESFIEFCDWEHTDEAEAVLFSPRKVKTKLTEFVYMEFSDLTDSSGNEIDDSEVRKNIDNLFKKDLSKDILIDIAN